MKWSEWSINYPGNCGPVHLTNVPRGETGSNHGDQTAYRAAIDAYYAISDTPRTLPPAWKERHR